MVNIMTAKSIFAYTCGGAETSIDFGKACEAEGATSVTALILWVVGFLAIGVGVAVVVGIVFGGITYIMSDGDPSQAKQARDIIANSIIGLFLFFILYAGANFLIPGGIFEP